MTAKPASRDRRYLLLIPLAAFAAVLPLIVHGCSCGHDFDFHLLNWIEAASQFSHGNLHPHWAYTPAYNAGEPRFVFYPPISWYLGAMLGLILTHLPRVTEAAAWTAVPILFTWVALTGSGLTLYRLAREFVAPNAALLAATIYLANPYMLFTAYERTAYAELLAAAWIPLLFLGILRPRVTIAGIAVPLALLWLTNAPAAVMSTYTLALLATLRLAFALVTAGSTPDPGGPSIRGAIAKGWVRRAPEARLLTLKITTATLLGLSLAAFYIVPAALEQPLVHINMVNVPGMRIQDSFLFEHTGASSDQIAHDTVLHTASLIAVAILIFTTLALATSLIRRTHSQIAKSLTILTAAILFLLTPWSLFLWQHAPEAAFLQFPWRLLAILATACALATAIALDRIALKPIASAVACLALATALAFPAWRNLAQRCFPEDTPAAQIAQFHSTAGTDPTDEYTPIRADNDALTQGNPPYWLASSPLDPPPPRSTPGVTPAHLTLTATHAEYVILNLRNFAHWVPMEGTNPYPQPQARPDGLIAIELTPGTHTIDLHYTQTRDQIAGDAVTLLAISSLLLTIRRRT